MGKEGAMEDSPGAQVPQEEVGGSGDPALEPITREMIAERAYLISQSDAAGTDEENWLRAERELREEHEPHDG
jgi:hypothetical protein